MKTKTPSLVTIAVLTTITIIFWLFFNIYRVFKRVPPKVVPEEVLKPLEQLDPTALSKLNGRIYAADYAVPVPVTLTSTPEATPQTTPIPSPTSSPSPSPSNTP